MTSERAETGNLEQLLARVGASLDEYVRFEHPDAFASRQSWRKALAGPLPEQGVGIDRVVEDLSRIVIPNGSAVPRPGFCAWVTTGATTASALASTAAAIASPQRYMPTAFNFLEDLALEWLAALCGIPGMQGVFSSGGSVANLVALGGARQAAFEKVGRDPAADGVDRPVRLYASEECHHTIQRACGVLGVGRRAVMIVPCDVGGRMQVDDLRQMVDRDMNAGVLPIAIVANAGTTNTGAIDPLEAIGRIASERGIWFHVDGAYGLPGILDERIAHLYTGLESADSVIVDPHKWLGASVGVAATFVRDRAILERAFTQEPADYLEGTVSPQCGEAPAMEHSMDDFGVRYYEYGVELSSPCRGVIVWAMLREIGAEGIRERIVRHNDMARFVARAADRHPNLELLIEPVLSICCFRYVDPRVDDLDSLNQQLHRRLVRENRVMPSTTRVRGKLALRPCFIGARTGFEHAEELVTDTVRIGESIAGEMVRARSAMDRS